VTEREAGQVGGIEAIAFGLLVVVIGVLLFSNAWGVVDAKTAARTAAREAARTYATAATSDPSVAEGEADLAARQTLAQMGWSRDDVSVRPVQPRFLRCAEITYVVTVPVPAFRLAGLAAGPASFRAVARHTERVDPYRSGVPGDPTTGAAACNGPER